MSLPTISKGKKRHENGTISFGKDCSAPIAVKHTLHYHHRDPTEKEFSVATAVRNGKNTKAIGKEIKKCIVLCANCHAIRHYDYHRGNLLDLGGKRVGRGSIVDRAGDKGSVL